MFEMLLCFGAVAIVGNCSNPFASVECCVVQRWLMFPAMFLVKEAALTLEGPKVSAMRRPCVFLCSRRCVDVGCPKGRCVVLKWHSCPM